MFLISEFFEVFSSLAYPAQATTPTAYKVPTCNQSPSLTEMLGMIAITQIPAIGIYLWHSLQMEILSEEKMKISSENELLNTKLNNCAEKQKIVTKEVSELKNLLNEKIKQATARLLEESKKSERYHPIQHKKDSFNIGVNLIEKYRHHSPAFSLKGRESEFEMLKVGIGKSETPNVLLVGPPGSGKTTLVEAWASEIAMNKNSSYLFKDTVIISISASELTGGCIYVGMLEDRVNQLIQYGKENPNLIFFIDELHSIINSGSSSTNGVPNMLKKALSDGDIRVIGCTTNEEFKIVEKDEAFTRRFSLVDFKQPTAEMIREIVITKVQNQYTKHHHVVYTEEVIEKALELTEFLPGNNPAKTLALLDTAGSLTHVRGLSEVTDSILLECANQT